MTNRHRRRLPKLTVAELVRPMIDPVPAGIPRPVISVMIPTFNCAALLRTCLASVLAQDLGPQRMHIEVVDDVSTLDDPEAVVREVGAGRVAFTRNAANLAATGNFNECLRRSRGELVHVLHGDDWVLPGFYAEILRMAAAWPEAGLYATRWAVTDETGKYMRDSDRMLHCERTPGREPGLLGASNVLQFVGTVMRRSAVESSGGFMPRLEHAADWEMWLRITGSHGLVMSAEVLACYRVFDGTDTSRLVRRAGNVVDVDAMLSITAMLGVDVQTEEVMREMRRTALRQYRAMRAVGDREGAKANFDYWVRRTSLPDLAGFARAGARRSLHVFSRRAR